MAVKQAAQSTRSIRSETVDEIRGILRGELLVEGDGGYDSARRVWNSMIDKHPAMIARCTGTADVVAAVNFARSHDIELAVRGGGHNVAGNAVIDDGLMIDLSPMKGIHVDPVRQTARAQAGATWGDLDHETQLHGLATPGGVVSSTGIAGFTLAGGMALTRRKWGLACDNLISVEVVTAAGQVVVASEKQNSDLFWAIRGGGGNFGVVTSFEYHLHPIGPGFYVAAPMYPIEDTARILREWTAFIEQAPDEISSDVIPWTVPPHPQIDPELVGVPIVLVVGAYVGSPEDAERELQPLREFGSPIVDLSHHARYVDIQSAFDSYFPDTQRYYWKSLNLRELSSDAIDLIAELGADTPTAKSLFALRALGGAMSRIPEDATAYGDRGALYNLSIDTTWDDPADDEKMIAWTRDAWSKIHDLTGGGVYLNFAGLGEDNDNLARGAYGRNYERLQEVKRRYDPDNLFRGNVNITPGD